MPARLAALTPLCRAISSSRLSTGCAMALDCTVLSTITRSVSAGKDGLDLHRRLNRGLEHLFQPVLAQQAPKAPNLRGVTRQARLVVLQPAEELPLNVFAPARESRESFRWDGTPIEPTKSQSAFSSAPGKQREQTCAYQRHAGRFWHGCIFHIGLNEQPLT